MIFLTQCWRFWQHVYLVSMLEDRDTRPTANTQHAMRSSIRKALQQARDLFNQDRRDNWEGGRILFALFGHGGQKGSGIAARQYLFWPMMRLLTIKSPPVHVIRQS